MADAEETPQMKKCRQLEALHKELVTLGIPLGETEKSFFTAYVVLAQSVYDDFAMRGSDVSYTLQRLCANVIWDADIDIQRNMKKYCDTSRATRLGLHIVDYAY